MKEVIHRAFAFGPLMAILLTSGCVPSEFFSGGKKPGPRPDDAIAIEASGRLVTDRYDYQSFTGIQVSGLAAVISQGEAFQIETEVDQNLLEHIVVTCTDRVLFVGLDPEKAYNMGGNIVRNARITLPVLESLQVSDIGSAILIQFDSHGALDVEVDGVSRVEGSLQAGTVHLRVGGLSEAVLSGSCVGLILDWTGHLADLGGLAATDVTIAADGIGSIVVNSIDTLAVSASGLVSITYFGDPLLDAVGLANGATLNPEE